MPKPSSVCTGLNIVVLFVNLLGIWILWPFVLTDVNAAKTCIDNETCIDIIHYAVQLGRLDAVSLLLAFLGVGLGTAAMFGFVHFGERAESVARERADIAIKKAVEEGYSLTSGKEGSGVSPSSTEPSGVDTEDLKPEGESNDS